MGFGKRQTRRYFDWSFPKDVLRVRNSVIGWHSVAPSVPEQLSIG